MKTEVKSNGRTVTVGELKKYLSENNVYYTDIKIRALRLFRAEPSYSTISKLLSGDISFETPKGRITKAAIEDLCGIRVV